ncbi:hypothetical protein NM688_g6807 [Phlebia brevispora]|uniref:Uncharacterized protein n=1 Tax=Phlebia brevispora TaxID=194682 RepID=A0ACC1SCB1_9APHY|nr:hypothetical protein NM688_g6807 [Phlebia brevispora]
MTSQLLFEKPKLLREHWWCAVCSATLKPRVCLGISNPKNLGRFYVTCDTCDFFRWASKRAHIFSALSNESSPEPPVYRTSLSQPLSAPWHNTSLNMRVSACSREGCTSSRINRQCTRHMCRRHCYEDGGCDANGHQRTRDANVHPPEAEERAMAAPTVSHVRIPSSHPPALPRSFSLPATLAAAASSTPALSAHRRRASSQASALPPEPEPPTLKHPRPRSSISHHPQPSTSSSRTGVPASAEPSSSKPRHSTQLAADVFDEEHRRLEQHYARERQRSANAVEAARLVEQQVTIVAYLANDTEPRIIEVQDTAGDWPRLQLSNDLMIEIGFRNPHTLNHEATHIETYNKALGLWSQVKSAFRLQVSSHETVFLRSMGVVATPGFQTLLRKDPFLQQYNDFRRNLPAERASVRQQQHASIIAAAAMLDVPKGQLEVVKEEDEEPKVPAPDNDNSAASDASDLFEPDTHDLFELDTRDTIIISSDSDADAAPAISACSRTARVDKGKQRAMVSPTPSPPVKFRDKGKQRAAVSPTPSLPTKPRDKGTPSSSPSLPSSPSISVKPVDKGKKRVLSPSTTSSPSSENPNDDAIICALQAFKAAEDVESSTEDEPLAAVPGSNVWPSGRYAVDMAACFHAVANSKGMGATVRTIFEDHFPGDKFNPSTYYAHAQRFASAPPEVRQSWIKFGRTEAGKWSNFMRVVPRPNAEIENARRRVARSKKNQQRKAQVSSSRNAQASSSRNAEASSSRNTTKPSRSNRDRDRPSKSKPRPRNKARGGHSRSSTSFSTSSSISCTSSSSVESLKRRRRKHRSKRRRED